MKKNIKIFGNMASILILCVTLVISVGYAWYTNNKNVSASGIASTASNSISVVSQGIYKTFIGDDPYPEEAKDKEISGLLSGDIIYYSVTIGLGKDKDENSLYDINIKAYDINGGEFFCESPLRVFENPDGELTDETYTLDEVSYNVYIKDGEKYIIKNVDGNDYVYYLYTSITGQVLTKSPKQIVSDPNGSPTGETFVYEGSEYLIYVDSNGKEYFVTYDIDIVDGEPYVRNTYINYIYEEKDNENNPIRFNMCDVYTIGIFKVFGTDSDGNYHTIKDYSDNVDYNALTREHGLDKHINFFNLYDFEAWNPGEYKEITFTFAIKFDFDRFKGKINLNCVSDKELVFTKIIIEDTEREVEE